MSLHGLPPELWPRLEVGLPPQMIWIKGGLYILDDLIKKNPFDVPSHLGFG